MELRREIVKVGEPLDIESFDGWESELMPFERIINFLDEQGAKGATHVQYDVLENNRQVQCCYVQVETVEEYNHRVVFAQMREENKDKRREQYYNLKKEFEPEEDIPPF